jgi:putative membrane protein
MLFVSLTISWENSLPAILNYLLHLFTAVALVLAFFVVYTRVTPYDEVLLVRQGNAAAALSLGGSLLGFSATIASSLVHTMDYYQFAGWAFGARVVQLLGYVIATRLLRMAKDQIEANNCAFGGLLGAISLSIGIINAGCIS